MFGLLNLIGNLQTVLNVVSEFVQANTDKVNEVKQKTGLDLRLDLVLIEQGGKKDLALVLRGLPDIWDNIIATLIDNYTNEKVEVVRCQ